MQKVRLTNHERADHNENERRASLEKPNVPVEIVGAESKTEDRKKESVKSILREDRGNGGGMRAKDRGVNTETQRRAMARESNRRSVRIGAGLSWEVGKVRSSNEASNDRGAKGPEFKGNVGRSQSAEIDMSLTTPPSVRELQVALYVKAKAKPAYRFYALYNKNIIDKTC